MALPKLHFLGWDGPLLARVAAWLLDRRDSLPRTLVVVPTAHSGRRLRVELARQAGGGLLAPGIATPDAIFRADRTGLGLVPAGEAMVRAAWAGVLVAVEPESLDPLIPRAEEMERDFAWAMQLTEGILPTMALLGEAGLAAEDVPSRCQAAAHDAGRWEVLGRLARRVEAVLRQAGRVSPEAAKMSAALAPRLPADTRHLVIAAVPDPVPLARLAWEILLESGAATVDVLVHAPDEAAGLFDFWGRPDKHAWADNLLPLPGGNAAIRMATDDGDAATKAVAACAGMGSDDVAMGVPDASLAPALEREFAAAGWRVFDPDGRVAGTTGLGVFLDSWIEVLRDKPVRFAAVSRWLRTPAAWVFLRGMEPPVSPFLLTKSLDELQAGFLPETLEDAARGASQWARGPESRKNHAWLKSMGEGMGAVFAMVLSRRAEFAAGRLGDAFGAMFDQLAAAGHDDGADGKLLDQLARATGDLTELETAFPAVAAPNLLGCWRRALHEIRTTSGHEDAVLDLLGWLELPYEPGANLVLAGMHDGIVPDSQRDDALLPDSTRAALGLRDRAARAARDAFLFRGMVESRAVGGSVTVIVAKFDGHGEPRKPSQLLLRCPSAELPGRVMHCFADLDAGPRVRPPSQRGGWQLAIPRDPERESRVAATMSPTKLKDYLACPFRFYLKHVLGMDRFEPDARELDPMRFGTLIHEVMEDFGRTGEALRQSRDAAEITAFLDESLDRAVARRFGQSLSLPLMVQVSSARERLAAMARRQAESSAGGWQIMHVEYPIGRRGGPGWSLAGCPMSMTIDRIDFHPGRRAWRVLDYKTSVSGKGPENEHLVKHRDGMPVPGELLAPSGRGGAPRRWASVQLPLYAACCRQVLLGRLPGARPDDAIECGYVLLPPAVGGVAISVWGNYDAALEASALEWSEGAIRAIRAGVFGPPAPPGTRPARWDDFAEIAPDGWDKTVAASSLAAFLGSEVPA